MRRRFNPVAAYVLGYPFLLPLMMVATWVTGRWSLGHWPRTSLDDPSTIGVWVNIPYHVAMVLVVFGLPAFGICMGLLLHDSWRNECRRKRSLTIAGAAALGMIGMVLVLRWDPLGIVDWFMD